MSRAADPGVVIVGAGQAGGRAAEALRQHGFQGPVTLVGDEPHPPYERPPLSKELLIEAGADKIAWVRPAAWYGEAGIALRTGAVARRIRRAEHKVQLDDGAELPYGALILATGARPRRLAVPGGDHPRCVALRTLADSAAIADRLGADAAVVVVGAGFIGLEVAAAARQRGARVTVLEIGPRPLARGVPAAVADVYAALHREQGVDLRTGTGVARIDNPGGRPVVVTTDGERLAADIVVVGIGVVPNVELAAEAGLAVDNGIVVDACGRTDDPAIWAAGDVANHPNPLIRRRARLESWANAQNQAIAVARNLIGPAQPYAAVPWFWSDQYGRNLQIAGWPRDDDRVVARGSALWFHLDGERLVAVAGIDAARDLRHAREIIALGGRVDAGALADPAVKLADLHRAAKAAA